MKHILNQMRIASGYGKKCPIESRIWLNIECLTGVLVINLLTEPKRLLTDEQPVMRLVGIEPTRPDGHMALNHACLPVPAQAQGKGIIISFNSLSIRPTQAPDSIPPGCDELN